MCRQYETLLIAENFTSRYQTRVTEVAIKRTCVTTEWYPFVKVLARGGYLFLIDI
jgi:hypothetical protein